MPTHCYRGWVRPLNCIELPSLRIMPVCCPQRAYIQSRLAPRTLQEVNHATELSRATLRKMHQNLWWAVGYNVIAFPLAAGVLYPLVLSPEVAALSMSGSTLIVALNALLLKRTKLAGIRQPGKTTASGSTDVAAAPEPAKASAVPANRSLTRKQPREYQHRAHSRCVRIHNLARPEYG